MGNHNMKRGKLLTLAAAGLVAACVVGSAQADLISGLQAYYNFDSNASDQMGVYNGTVVGATHTGTGKIGGAYDFSGNQYISVGLPMPVGNDARAISLWVKPRESSGESWTGLFDAGTDGGGNDWSLGMNNNNDGYGNGNDLLYVRRYYEDVQTTRNLTIAPNAWHHVVVSYDATYNNNLKFYLDGTLVPTDLGYSWNVGFNTVPSIQAIGGYYFPSFSTIDEVGIWDRSLTAQEVTQLYNNSQGVQLGNIGATVPDGGAGSLALTALGCLMLATLRRLVPVQS